MPEPAAAARLTELEVAMVELARTQQKTEANLDKSRANNDRGFAESRTLHAETEQTLRRYAAETKAHLDQLSSETNANLDRLSAETKAHLDQVSSETNANLDRLSAETKAHLDQLSAETNANLDRLSAEMRASDKRWGEMAKKMGTMVEDLLAPSIANIFQRITGIDEEPLCGFRFRQEHRRTRQRREFDAAARAGDTYLVVEVKATVRPEDIVNFAKLLPEVHHFCRDAEGLKVIGAMGSLHIEPDLVTAGERRGLVMIAMGGRLLQILNSPGFKPKEH